VSRIETRFRALGQQGRKALIPFITAGDPAPQATVPLMHAMVAAGADIIELGVPFSDPMADGPVIQRASERALRHHVSLHNVLDMVGRFRQDDDATPVVLMGYLNPIEVMGYAAFAQAAGDAGVDGALTVDLPPEEAMDFVAQMREHSVDPIFLVAPTSSDERIQRICAVASGFIYYVSLRGVTGAKHLDIAEVAAKLAQVRRHTGLPIGVGFGITDAQSAAQVGEYADAVVVGSALVRRIEELQDQPERMQEEIVSVLGSMRAALDNLSSEPSALSH